MQLWIQVQHFRWYVLRRMIAIHSHLSKQQITNLIKYVVVIGVIPAYNTTNNPNVSLSHQFTYDVPCNETAEISLFFCSFISQTTTPCFTSRWSKCQIYSNHNTFFYTYSFPILLLEFTLKCTSFMHSLQCKFQCKMLQDPFSIEFHHTINIPTSWSYLLKFIAVASFCCHESNSKAKFTQN